MCMIRLVRGRLQAFVDDPRLAAAAVPVGAIALFEVKGGGFDSTTFYPVALLLLGLVAVIAISQLRAGYGPPRAALAAIVCFAAYTAWCYASIAWSADQGTAWVGANRTLLYLALFTGCVLLPWRRQTFAGLLALLCLWVAGSGLWELARAAKQPDPDQYFQLGRFAASYGYQNVAAACFLMAFWPLVVIASRREIAPVFRAVAMGGASMLPCLALLAQSRASLVAFPATLLVLLLLVPRRARTLAAVMPPLLLLAVFRGRFLDVYPAIRDGREFLPVVARARNAVELAGAAGVVCGFAFAAVDLLVLQPRLRRAAATTVLAAAAAVTVAGLVAGAVFLHHPVARLDHAWTTFKHPAEQPANNSSYFSAGVGGNRYDFWRVAWAEFRAHPAGGVGVDNFQLDYLLDRRSFEEPLYPHSFELRLLSETGVVGAALFLAFVACVVATLRRLRRVPPDRRALAGGAVAVVVYFLIHGSIDWFWEIPAAGGFAILALGAAVSFLNPPRELQKSRQVVRAAALPAVAVLVVAGAAAITPAWLAAEDVARAASGWGTDPERAFSRLDSARRLNPLSSEPDLVAGAIAIRLRDYGRAEALFRRALTRQPRDWYAHVELAALATDRRDWSVARRELTAARRLNPLEPTIQLVERHVEDRTVLKPSELDRIFLARIKR
jgi:tetratricopeptide (TPR) repeat protein